MDAGKQPTTQAEREQQACQRRSSPQSATTHQTLIKPDKPEPGAVTSLAVLPGLVTFAGIGGRLRAGWFRPDPSETRSAATEPKPDAEPPEPRQESTRPPQPSPQRTSRPQPAAPGSH